MNISEIKALLSELGTHPKKALGQNFLTSKPVIQKILSEAEGFERIVEIGPGLGAITRGLRELSDDFIVLELDKMLCQYWRDQGVDIREGDALKYDWSQIDGRRSVLVSNLPYQISSSIVIDRSVSPFGIEKMVLMFQKEVGQRLFAEAGGKEYGLLTVIAQYYWKIANLVDAGPRDFYPPPKVASRVLTFERIDRDLSDSQDFLKFVKAGFSQRRKYLWKNLQNNYKSGSLAADQIKSALVELDLSEQARAEEVAPETFYALFEKLGK